jgi:hypothetical protein
MKCFPFGATNNLFLISRVPKRAIFVKQLQRLHSTIQRHLDTLIEEHIYTADHMRAVRVSFLGRPAALCGILPIPLETVQI